MLHSYPLLISLLAYLAAAILVAQQIRAGVLEKPVQRRQLTSAVIIVALASHLLYAYQISFIDFKLNFALASMVILVSAILVLIYWLGSLALPIRRLGILVFPLTIICLLFAQFWPAQDSTNLDIDTALSAHILVSIVAYSLIAIAAIQAVLYAYQERQIKNRANPAMLMALPPLQTMETLLFRLVWFGFALLTLTLISGAVFSREIFGVAFAFNHHTILALLGWIVFAALLFMRVKHNLTGSQAVAWTIGGFVLIQLGYFGTKVVSESLSVQ